MTGGPVTGRRLRGRPRRDLLTLLLAGGAAITTACSGVTYADTPVPTPPATSAAPAAPATPATCADATASYDPLPALPPANGIPDAKVRAIRDRGHLVVGVSADTYLFAARNPISGRIEGFDIDIAREVARALFGDPDKIQLRVITAADRIPLLEKQEVDMVVRNMTMTCDRWTRIAFSAEYYHSGQKVLVAKGSTAVTLADLKGKRVCAPRGTSSLDKLRSVSGPVPVTAENHTGCLVLFQQGKADAITGDDTVLAGLAAQDPYTVVTKAPAITAEPYGIGLNKSDVYLARYVNRVLADVKASGRWRAIYTTWLAGPLGPAPAPPTAVYGR
ncbi:MAG TPA: glutamate ABC transporter substrate-binding protein [Intrasporangium sp.]|uniref:glutamate ABC transporter substrate-binding protein n=1 Tax=Intrasporangium sp. TaxID=1925024 RepID=UPI002D780405|nr:glutamate ABC transporter substrate-binding protein [Intrasporangium sp.]HET7398724.1 glutamate ABC transporter substrate-binding protein [Intrasporangium sp.]